MSTDADVAAVREALEVAETHGLHHDVALESERLLREQASFSLAALDRLEARLQQAERERDDWETRSDVVVETMEAYKARAEAAEAREKALREALKLAEPYLLNLIAAAKKEPE